MESVAAAAGRHIVYVALRWDFGWQLLEGNKIGDGKRMPCLKYWAVKIVFHCILESAVKKPLNVLSSYLEAISFIPVCMLHSVCSRLIENIKHFRGV